MTVREIVEHTLTNVCDVKETKFKLEPMQDNNHTVIIHCERGLFHTKLTKELRERAIHISATAKMEDEWPLSIFLTDIEARQKEEVESQ